MKFFSSIFKQKKIIFFAFLFLVVFSFTFFGVKIETVKADCVSECKNLYPPGSGLDIGNLQPCLDRCSAGGTAAGIGVGANPVGDKCQSSLTWYQSIAAGISDILLFTPKQIAYWTTSLAGWVVSKVLDWPITNTSSKNGAALAFTSGWTSVKDLANMLIVLGFVIVGIATTLRIQDYAAKKFLGRLIIIALLINFSGLFCGLIIDAAHLTMNGLLPKGTSSMGWNFYLDIQRSEKTITCDALRAGNLSGYIMANVLFGCMYSAIAFCFSYLALTLIARYVILGILFILSPLAFAFWAFPFPKAKDLWNKWWEHFLKWAFVGVGISFFLNLAGNMLKGFPISNTGATDTSTLTFYLAIILTVIIVGIKITTNASKLASTAVIGLATGGASLAMGAASVTGLKGVAQKYGNQAKDKATSFGEKHGMVAKGTTAQNQAGRLATSTKRLDNIQDNSELAKIAEQSAMTHTQSQDKAAAAQILAKRNAFDKVDPKKRDAVAKHAEAFGVSRDTFTKVAPQTLTGASDSEATEKATHDAAKIDSNLTGRSMKESLNALKSANYKPSTNDVRGAKLNIEKRKVTENALGLAPVTDKEVHNKLVDDALQGYISAGHTREEAMSLNKNYIPNAGEIAGAKESLSQEKIDKAFAKLDIGGIRALPKEALSSSAFLKNIGATQLKTAGPRMSQDKMKEVKKLLDSTTEEGKAIDRLKADLSAKSTAGDMDAKKELSEIKKKLVEIKRW